MPLLSLLFSLFSCNEPTHVEVRLHGPPTFDPKDALGEITLRIEESETGDRVGGKGSGTVDASDPAMEGIALQEGVPYRVLVEGVAERCTVGTATGESLSFVHDEDGDVVDVYVACHGEAWSTPDLPEARALHTASWIAAESRAVVTGGVARAPIDASGIGAAESTASVLDMDVATGAWTPAPDLVRARRFHAAVEVPEGLAIFGGTGDGPFAGADSVELFSGTARNTRSNTDSIFTLPAAVALEGRVLLAGWGFQGLAPTPLALYDVGTEETEVVEAARTIGALGGAGVVALDGGRRALVVGGAIGLDSGDGLVGGVRLYCEDACGGCEAPPCLVDVPAEETLPGPDWSAMATAYVPCAAGGGAVIAAGGNVGLPSDSSTTDSIWCWRDEPDALESVERAPETLSAPRAGAAVGWIERLGGGYWVIVAGGSDMTPALPDYPSGADRIAINGCTCDVESVDTMEIPPGSGTPTRTVGAAMMQVGDGSLVLVGGMEEWAGTDGEVVASRRVVRFR